MYSQNGAYCYYPVSQEIPSQISREELKFVIDTTIDRSFGKVPNLMGNKTMENLDNCLFKQNDKLMEIKALVKRIKSNFPKNYNKYEKNIEKISFIYCSVSEKLEKFVEFYEIIKNAILRESGLEISDIENFNQIMQVIDNNTRLKNNQLNNINTQRNYFYDLKNLLFEKITKLEEEVKSIINERQEKTEETATYNKMIENLNTITSRVDTMKDYHTLYITNTSLKIGKEQPVYHPPASFYTCRSSDQ